MINEPFIIAIQKQDKTPRFIDNLFPNFTLAKNYVKYFILNKEKEKDDINIKILQLSSSLKTHTCTETKL